tara:strand:- start:17140 stop:19167 length:2028 start_codon:yes stop_codon:yes gene_type:complete
MKSAIIIQARLNSKRFKNKIMKKIGSFSSLELQIKRLKKCKSIDEIILATGEKNIYFYNLCKDNNIKLFNGSEKNVFSRYFNVSKKYNIKTIIRITADCPFIDPNLIDEICDFYKKNSYDFVSNTIIPSYPDGFDVEIFSSKILNRLHKMKLTELEKEHVTLKMYKLKNISKFNYLNKNNLSKYRFTLDYEEDLIFLNKVYKKLKDKFNFKLFDLLKILNENKKLNIFPKNFKRNQDSFFNKGQEQWSKAKNLIAGGNMLVTKNPDMFLPQKWPSYYKNSFKNYIIDLDNIKYLDMSYMGVGTNILGYKNKNVDQFVKKAISKGVATTLNCPEEIQLAENLIKLHPWFDKVKFTRTGGEAAAVAVRLARTYSKKNKIAICGYHGWHDWYLSTNLNNEKNLDKLLLPGLSPNGIPKSLKNISLPFFYNDLQSFKRIINHNNDIGAVIMEVERNQPPKNNFLEKIRKITKQKNIPLIFDECTSGFRETNGGLHKKYKIYPDLCIFGKALGNGYAINAIMGKDEIMNNISETFISSTNWTESIGVHAGIGSLIEMNRIKSWKIITKNGKYLRTQLKRIFKKNKLDFKISGLPSLTNFEIISRDWYKYKAYITQEMLKQNILANNVIYLSIHHDKKIIDRYLKILNSIFNIIYKFEVKKLNVNDYLENNLPFLPFKRLN